MVSCFWLETYFGSIAAYAFVPDQGIKPGGAGKVIGRRWHGLQGF
jgi:hypothetical protein